MVTIASLVPPDHLLRKIDAASDDSHRVRSVLVARAKLVGMKRTLSNTIRSLLKTFGQFTQRARGKSFADRVRSLVADESLLGKRIEGLLASWEAVSRQIRDLDRLLGGLARRDPVCRDILMTAPGVGATSRATDRMGCISRCGDALLRGYLFEAATLALTRAPRENAPVTWAKAIMQRVRPDCGENQVPDWAPRPDQAVGWSDRR